MRKAIYLSLGVMLLLQVPGFAQVGVKSDQPNVIGAAGNQTMNAMSLESLSNDQLYALAKLFLVSSNGMQQDGQFGKAIGQIDAALLALGKIDEASLDKDQKLEIATFRKGAEIQKLEILSAQAAEADDYDTAIAYQNQIVSLANAFIGEVSDKRVKAEFTYTRNMAEIYKLTLAAGKAAKAEDYAGAAALQAQIAVLAGKFAGEADSKAQKANYNLQKHNAEITQMNLTAVQLGKDNKVNALIDVYLGEIAKIQQFMVTNPDGKKNYEIMLDNAKSGLQDVTFSALNVESAVDTLNLILPKVAPHIDPVILQAIKLQAGIE
ncbi:MAG: hypothetical protein JW734_04540 [Candidatus Omnitrophica bacterium]|nr:hypothetical protein [Candidatus Omnitrophota bacterium]